VPARLVSRPVRPLPRQRDLNFHHETILTDGGSQGPPFLLGEFFRVSKKKLALHLQADASASHLTGFS
jgi:hypothetical protein